MADKRHSQPHWISRPLIIDGSEFIGAWPELNGPIIGLEPRRHIRGHDHPIPAEPPRYGKVRLPAGINAATRVARVRCQRRDSPRRGVCLSGVNPYCFFSRAVVLTPGSRLIVWTSCP